MKKLVALMLAFSIPSLALAQENYGLRQGDEVSFKSVASGGAKITARWLKAPEITIPNKALREGQNALALVICKIDETGTMHQCRLGRENPAFNGWGAAVVAGLEGAQIDPASPDKSFAVGEVVVPMPLSFHNTVMISEGSTGGMLESEALPYEF